MIGQRSCVAVLSAKATCRLRAVSTTSLFREGSMLPSRHWRSAVSGGTTGFCGRRAAWVEGPRQRNRKRRSWRTSHGARFPQAGALGFFAGCGRGRASGADLPHSPKQVGRGPGRRTDPGAVGRLAEALRSGVTSPLVGGSGRFLHRALLLGAWLVSHSV